MVAPNQSRYYLFPFLDANFTKKKFISNTRSAPSYSDLYALVVCFEFRSNLMSILLLVYDDLFLQTPDMCRRILIPVFSLFILRFISP
jgi:hypothetical protein